MHRSPLGRALQQAADNGPVRAVASTELLKTRKSRTPAQHPPDPCQEPGRRPSPVQESTVKARRPFQVPGTSLPDPSGLNSPSSRCFPFLHGLLSLFRGRVELCSFRDVYCKQKRSTRSSTASGCPTLDAQSTSLSFDSFTPLITTRCPFRRSILSFPTCLRRTLLDDIARPRLRLFGPASLFCTQH